MTGPLFVPDDILDDVPADLHEAKLRHPSTQEPRTLRVVGSPWEAHEHDDGQWSFMCHGETIWGPMNGNIDDAFKLLLQVHRDPSPRAESQGPRPGPTPRFWRGVAWAVPASLALWVVIIYSTGKVWGKW
jgi:hypothetical protein